MYNVNVQHHLSKLIKTTSFKTKERLLFIIGFLLFFNVVVWVIAYMTHTKTPALFGLITIAYALGLRHAVDADHIAAIDNTTRKLMQDGEKPVSVGFFFSLGHSTIVVILSLLIACSASFIKQHLPLLQTAGSLVGTGVSSFFLLLIGIVNLITFIHILKKWQGVVKMNANTKVLHGHLQSLGFLARILKPFLKTVDTSWKMYPIGLLFGLGFDTASEVGLLSISAISGAKGMPMWEVLLLPISFTAGMCLIDTLDGILMLGAYGWSHIKPVRKLYYNMSLTFLSSFIALFIGGIEGLQVISLKTGDKSGLFQLANNLQFTNFGFIIIGVFVIMWFVSIAIYKLKQYDLIELQ